MKKMIKLAVGVAAFSATAAIAGPSPQTGNLSVTASVSDSCAVSSTTAVAFGAYDPLSATNNDNTGSVTVRCTKGTVYHVALGQGSNPTGTSTCTAPARQMSDGGTERLGYDLYTNVGRTTAWGCTTSNDVDVTSASSAANAMTVYGRIPAGQDVATGGYSDTVVVTVTFP
jgi:spore coat protein U-like protein